MGCIYWVCLSVLATNNNHIACLWVVFVGVDVIKDHDRMHSFGVRLSLEGERCSGQDRRGEIGGADAAEEEEVKKPDKDGFKSDSARRSGDAVVQSSYPSTERVEGQIGEHEVVPAQPPIEVSNHLSLTQ